MEKKNKPQIRFKGFNEDWQPKILDNLFEITSASRVLKNEWTDDGVPFFRSSDVVSAYKGTDNTKAFISFELYKKLSSISGCVQKDDLLVTGGGSIGIPYLVRTNEQLYFKDADLLWLKSADKINGYFLYTFFSTIVFRNYVNSITHIGTISHYTIEQAKATPLIVPIQTEQNLMGNFFENLDKLITEHQQKHNKLKELKKAMLFKMFPQQSQNVPEIRFKGYEGDWEKTTLEKTSDFFKGKGLNKNEVSRTGRNKCILYGHLFTEYGMIIENISFYTNMDLNTMVVSQFGDVLIPSSSTTPTGIEKASSIEEDDVILGGDINILRPKKSISGSFLSININAIGYKIIPFIKGITVRHLYNSDLKKVEIHIPKSLKEQEKIVCYFKSIDQLITKQELQIKKLQNIKKAFLAKMFI